MKNIMIGTMLALTAVAHAATKVPVQMLDTTGSTNGQVIVSPGPSGAPAWGSVSAGALAPLAANTVLANATGSTTTPTAIPMPSCSGTNNALRWTSGTGFACASGIALATSALNQFAATTSAQLASVISDETGSGALVFGTNPTISGLTVTGGSINNTSIGATTPGTGAFTTLSASSAITPSPTAGIVGTTTNNNANAGSVGEYQSITGSAVSLTSAAYTDIATLTLSAGDWDVEGSVGFATSGATTSALVGGVSTTANTNPNSVPGVGFTVAMAAGGSTYLSTPVVRFSLASSTTVRLGAQANFTGGSVTGTGMLRARRVR